MTKLAIFLLIILLSASTAVTGIVQAIEPTWTFCTHNNARSPSVAISTDGTHLAATVEKIYTFNASTGEVVWAGGKANAVFLPGNGSEVVTATDTGIKYLTLAGTESWFDSAYTPVVAVSITPDGTYLAAVEGARIVSYRNREQIFEVTSPDHPLSIDISQDGAIVVVGMYRSLQRFNQNGGKVWNIPTTGEVRHVFIGHPVRDVIAGAEHILYRYDRFGNKLWEIKASDTFQKLAVTPDLNYIVAANRDNYIYFLNQSGQVLWKYNVGNWVNSLAITPDGSYIAVGGMDRKIYLFDQEGTMLWNYTTPSWVTSVSLSADGHYLAAASKDGTIYLFNTSFTSKPIDIVDSADLQPLVLETVQQVPLSKATPPPASAPLVGALSLLVVLPILSWLYKRGYP